MNEYHIKTLKEVSVVKLDFFLEEENGERKYDRLIIDDGYGVKWNLNKPTFGFIFEQVDKIDLEKRCFTMTKFKTYAEYLEVVSKYYDNAKNETKDIFITEEEQIFIKAQIMSDINYSVYNGAHCSLYLKLVGFRCIKKE